MWRVVTTGVVAVLVAASMVTVTAPGESTRADGGVARSSRVRRRAPVRTPARTDQPAVQRPAARAPCDPVPRSRAPAAPDISAREALSLLSILDASPPARDPDAAMRDALSTLELRDDELLALLDDQCGIEPGDVPRGVDVLDFTARVARIAARGLATEPRFYEDDFASRFPAGVAFSVATDEDGGAVRPAMEFPPSAERLYATFATETLDAPDVLVKWTHVDLGFVCEYGTHAVTPRAEHGFVWLEPEGDWPCGAYAVEIYALDRTLRPLAGGRYVIR